MKKLFSLVLNIILILSLCACGSKSTSSENYYVAESATYSEESALAYSYEDADYSTAGFSGTTSSSQNQASSSFESDKIIYSGDAAIETMEFDQCCTDIESMIESSGGFIESSYVRGTDFNTSNYRYANYVFRVPCSEFHRIMNSLSAYGNVPYSSIDADNISSEYHDTEKHLESFQIEQDRLLELLEEAETVDEILQIEDRLTEVRYNIDSYSSTLSNWDSLVNFSTITLSVEEVSLYTPDPEEELRYGQRLWYGFTNAIKGIGNFFKEFLVLFVTVLPVLVLLGCIAAIIIFFIKRISKKRKKKNKENNTASNLISSVSNNDEKK